MSATQAGRRNGSSLLGTPMIARPPGLRTRKHSCARAAAPYFEGTAQARIVEVGFGKVPALAAALRGASSLNSEAAANFFADRLLRAKALHDALEGKHCVLGIAAGNDIEVA